MKKLFQIFFILLLLLQTGETTKAQVIDSTTILFNIDTIGKNLGYPWEITYGPDNNLWITESKGYKVYRMDPTTGVKTTVLDISQGSTFLPLPDRTFNCQFANGSGAQGGLAGLALHPNFLDGTANENNSVYISYIYSSNGGTSPSGLFYTNRLVKFSYNAGTGKLESPVSLCDTLPGSSDHNSQRIIIAPVTPGGTKYLFYAAGDMGAGQFGNRTRPQYAQNPNKYEGKILRFNLVSDGDAGLAAWIPNDNPYSATSAVYCIGIRNNQGFAYDTSLNILYGASHGPYSDDEINIIQGFKNGCGCFVVNGIRRSAVYIKRYPKFLERILNDPVVLVDDLLRCDSLLPCLDRDGDSMFI